MALRPLKPCKLRGCHNLTRDKNGYCEEHKDMSSSKEYNRQRLDRREQSFYNSGAWKKVRGLRLSMDNGLCQHCLREKKVSVADTVHHIQPIKSNWDKRLDIDNLISLCFKCHNKVHGR